MNLKKGDVEPARWGIPPEHDIQDTVWIVSRATPGEVSETYVLGYMIEGSRLTDRNYDPEGQLALFLRAYKLASMNFDETSMLYGQEYFPPEDVVARQEHAEHLAVFLAINEAMTEEAWTLAIGDEAREEIDDCDLQICCATISAIRDVLFTAKKSGGLLRRDAGLLRQLLSVHEPPPNLARVTSPLRGVLKDLELDWAALWEANKNG